MLWGMCACVQIIYRNTVNLWFFWVWSLKDFPSNKKAWPPEAKKFTQWEEKKSCWEKNEVRAPRGRPCYWRQFLSWSHTKPREGRPREGQGRGTLRTKARPFGNYVNRILRPVRSPSTPGPGWVLWGWIASYPKKMCWIPNQAVPQNVALFGMRIIADAI